MTATANIFMLSETPGHDLDQVASELQISINKVRRAALSLERSVRDLEDSTEMTKQSVEDLFS